MAPLVVPGPQPFQDHHEIPHLNFPIEPMIDEEIPLHLVMNENPLSDEEDNDLPEENNDQENDGNGILNVGAVIIRDEFITNPAGLIEFWLTTSDSSPGKKVAAQTQWAPFFTSMLLSRSNYKWVKSFIQSEA